MENGKVLAHTTGNRPGEWEFGQNMVGSCVFRTYEDAEKALEIKAKIIKKVEEYLWKK